MFPIKLIWEKARETSSQDCACPDMLSGEKQSPRRRMRFFGNETSHLPQPSSLGEIWFNSSLLQLHSGDEAVLLYFDIKGIL